MVPTVCAVCLRSLSITSCGLIRAHGPTSARCPGSGKPPRLSPAGVPLPIDAPLPSPRGPPTPPSSLPLPAMPAVATIPKPGSYAVFRSRQDSCVVCYSTSSQTQFGSFVEQTLPLCSKVFEAAKKGQAHRIPTHYSETPAPGRKFHHSHPTFRY